MTRKYLHIVIAGLIFIVALGAYWYWWGVVSEKSAEAAQITQELQTLGDASCRTSSIRRALEELEAQEAQVYGHFVGNDTIVSFLEEVESTGDALGARVEVVSVGNAQGKTNQLQMALRITGSFDAVMRTLGALEYQPYDTTLASVTVDTPGQGVWAAAATFHVGTLPGQAPTTQP